MTGRRERTLSHRPYRGDGKKGAETVQKKGVDPVTDRTEVTGRREGTLSQRPYRGDGKKGGDPVTETVQR